MPLRDPALDELISQLVETLHQELHQHRRLLGLVRKKKQRLFDPPTGASDPLLGVEKEILADIVTVERDRISLLVELGQILGHADPSRLRLAELVHHSSPEGRDELLDLRDDFRDVADELEALTSVEPRFARHNAGQIRLYVDAPGAETGVAAAAPSRRRSRGVESAKGGIPTPGTEPA